MLPGNTVLRKAARDVAFEGVSIPRGSYLWLYPNAVHQDPCYFEEPAKFCPMRFLSGREGGGAVAGGAECDTLQRQTDEFELVTFGHGRQRCIGEKMARAMILSFLGVVLPSIDASAPSVLPADDNLFDLIPASELELSDVRACPPPSPGGEEPRTESAAAKSQAEGQAERAAQGATSEAARARMATRLERD